MTKKEKKGKNKFRLCFLFQLYKNDCGFHRSPEICDKKLILREKNRQINGLVNKRRLILSYIMQLVIANICT